MKTYRIQGLVIDSRTQRKASGLRVEAWDKDLIFDDLVGSSVTDARGNFQMEFDESYFRELFIDRQLTIYFKVFWHDHLIKSTEDSVFFNVEADQTEIFIEVDLPILATGDAELVFAFEELTTLDLADLLLAVNEIAVRSAISWLRKQAFAKDRWPSATEGSVKLALNHLGSSYYAFANRRHGYQRSPSENHRGAAWTAFDEDLDGEMFAKWVKSSLRDSAVSSSSIREGNSIIVSLSFAAIAAMTAMPVDYSLTKDLTTYTINWLRNGIRQRPPKDTLDSVPSIIASLAKHKNVKKFRLRTSEVELDVLFEHKSISRGNS